MRTLWRYDPGTLGTGRIGIYNFYKKISSDGSDIIRLSSGYEVDLNAYRHIQFSPNSTDCGGVDRWGNMDDWTGQEARDLFKALEKRCTNPGKNPTAYLFSD